MPDGRDHSGMMIPGYETEVVGAGARIIRHKKPMMRKEWKEEAAKFKCRPKP